jgi:hypothetical protein
LLVELGGRRDKEIIMKKKHVWLSIEAAHFEILCVCVFLLVNQNIDAQ